MNEKKSLRELQFASLQNEHEKKCRTDKIKIRYGIEVERLQNR